ncbi:MAG: CHAD domain-containing protein [Planctomycetes bacterium]|nr:CHAD domain-containing protein [Planctomycetota bacterium]
MPQTPTNTSPTSASAPAEDSKARSAWSDLAHRRLAEHLGGLERWRRAALEDFDPHAVLKLRAHARRIELAAATFAPEIEASTCRTEIEALRALAEELLRTTTALRMQDLATDYFHSVYRGLGDSTAAEAAEIYSDWLYEECRDAVIDVAEKELRALSMRAVSRAKKVLRELASAAVEVPPLEAAIERVSAAGRRAWLALRPLVVDFDQSGIAAARAELRSLRYTWKALKPCFPAESYSLNHDHAHRLQTLLGQAGDIERWVLDAEGFVEHPSARRAGVRPQDWDRVLRYAWAQRLNLLHQVGRHALVRHWLSRDGASAGLVRPLRPDLAP